MNDVNGPGTSAALVALLQSKLGSQILSAEVSLGDAVIQIPRQGMHEFFRLLKLDAELGFSMFIDVTVVDWLDARPNRFEVVYHLLNLAQRARLRVKIAVPESNPEVDSVSDLWSAANFMEREAWDMYGVTFKGHPDQRRILMYDEFEGHPLRKDYPVQGKQPRIPLRSPEVRNTAVDMARPNLVSINRRAKQQTANG
jgi:NADH-quinone oxidoreductase subunit C